VVEQAESFCPWGRLLEIYLSSLEFFKTLVHFKARNGSRLLFGIMLVVVIDFLRLSFLIVLEWLVSKVKWCKK